MQLTDSSQSPVATAGQVASAESATIQQCDECGAPVDKDQRYCVSCGAQRRHVNDPAARYLSKATARSRSAKAATSSAAPRGGARTRGLALALAIALVPVAAAAGVIAGRSSNDSDAKLIQALDRRQSAAGATATATVPAASSKSASTQTKAVQATAKHHAAKSSSNTTPSTKNAGKVISKTQNGTAQQITGFKPTKSQEQQGASATKQVQKSTGKSYVTGQNNLPSQVVVP
jgi:hypothetical protein